MSTFGHGFNAPDVAWAMKEELEPGIKSGCGHGFGGGWEDMNVVEYEHTAKEFVLVVPMNSGRASQPVKTVFKWKDKEKDDKGLKWEDRP